MSLRSSFQRRHAWARAHARLALEDASRAACLVLLLVAAAPLAAQQAPPAGGAVPDANAAARAANDRLRGVSKEDSLLGGPSMSRDPYRSALDAEDTRQSDLMRAERVPNGAMNGNGYDRLPAPNRAPNARAPGANAPANAALNPGGVTGNAAPVGGNAPANTPAQAAQSLYRDPFKGPNGAAEQVYRSPW